MAVEPARIESLAEGDAALAGGIEAIEVAVQAVVPEWLGTLVSRAHANGVLVIVVAEPAEARSGEALDGWEIGVCTAALAAGVDEVIGLAPKRVARVRAVLRELDAAARREVAT